MNPFFNKLLDAAARMTRTGNLAEATVAVQRAMQPLSGTNNEDDAAPSTSRSDSTLTGVFQASTGERNYRLFVPEPEPETARPLVMMLHGCTQDAEDFERGTVMNEAAREDGALILYPEQTREFNPQGCWNWFETDHQRRGQGEAAILAEMAQSIANEYGVDPARIYVAGLSAGGAMAAILGQTYPEIFAAIGVHSGLAAGSASNVSEAMARMRGDPKSGQVPMSNDHTNPMPPTIVLHGDQDGIVHLDNSAQVVGACLSANDQAAKTSQSTVNGREVTRTIYRANNGQTRAEQWIIHGGQHAWSGGSPTGSFADEQGPNASAEILRFFKANSHSVQSENGSE